MYNFSMPVPVTEFSYSEFVSHPDSSSLSTSDISSAFQLGQILITVTTGIVGWGHYFHGNTDGTLYYIIITYTHFMPNLYIWHSAGKF